MWFVRHFNFERKMGLKFWLNVQKMPLRVMKAETEKHVEAFKQSGTMIGMWWRKGRSWVGGGGEGWIGRGAVKVESESVSQ